MKKPDTNSAGYTVDTPVPYVLADLVGLIDERMGKLENRSTRMTYHKLMSRIEGVRSDPRYAFMFENANVGGDTIGEVLTQLFRLIPNGKPMTIMQLAGFPVEVVDAVVSVLGRMAFDFGLWSDGAAPMLFVCEEAHRYASADRNIGFGPVRRAFSRIAKEGRKYGVFLGLVTQRPAELDPTILSQCSTLFVMRMANDRDQAILRSAVSDAAANLLDFIPSLGTREAFAFGEGVALPTRLTFKDMPPHARPYNEAVAHVRMQKGAIDQEFIASVVERWRGTTSGSRFRPKSSPFEAQLAAQAPVPPPRPAGGIDAERIQHPQEADIDSQGGFRPQQTRIVALDRGSSPRRRIATMPRRRPPRSPIRRPSTKFARLSSKSPKSRKQLLAAATPDALRPEKFPLTAGKLRSAAVKRPAGAPRRLPACFPAGLVTATIS